MIENNHNPKRVLMTSSIKVSESPHKISGKYKLLSQEQVLKEKESEKKRLKHAQNLLMK